MTITKIEQQKKNPNRFSVFVDGQFSFGMDGVDLLFHKLHEGLFLSEATYEQIVEENLVVKAKEKALSFVSYRMRSEQEVVQKLTQSEFGAETIERVVDFLKRNRLIDDVAFAKAFVADKMRLSGFGHVRIRHELLQKGVSKTAIEAAYLAMEDEWAEDENDTSMEQKELDKAVLLLEKKFCKEDVSNTKERMRAQNFLLRKGYSYDTIAKAMNRFAQGSLYKP